MAARATALRITGYRRENEPLQYSHWGGRSNLNEAIDGRKCYYKVWNHIPGGYALFCLFPPARKESIPISLAFQHSNLVGFLAFLSQWLSSTPISSALLIWMTNREITGEPLMKREGSIVIIGRRRRTLVEKNRIAFCVSGWLRASQYISAWSEGSFLVPFHQSDRLVRPC